jgi:hypothetical protein
MDDQQQSKPRIVIEFDGEGSAHFQLAEIDPRITPLQLFSLAAWMHFKAEFILSLQEHAALDHIRQQQEMNRIVVPEGAKRLLK